MPVKYSLARGERGRNFRLRSRPACEFFLCLRHHHFSINNKQDACKILTRQRRARAYFQFLFPPSPTKSLSLSEGQFDPGGVTY